MYWVSIVLILFYILSWAYLWTARYVVSEFDSVLRLRQFGLAVWSIPLDQMDIEEDSGALGGLLIRNRTNGSQHTVNWSVFPKSLLPAIVKVRDRFLDNRQRL